MYDIDINQYCHNFGSVPVVAIVTGEPTLLPFIPGETQRVHVIDENTPFLGGNDPALQALNDMREAKRKHAADCRTTCVIINTRQKGIG